MPVTHVVKQGETLSEIAFKFGFADAETLYQHADNKALREKRQSLHLLHPGDEVVLPDKQIREVKEGTGKKHRFRQAAPTKTLKLKLHDKREPDRFSQRPYTFSVSDDVGGKDYTGELDQDGVLSETVHVSAKEGVLKVRFEGAAGSSELTLQVLIDHLDPVETLTGQQARLANLGYDCGEIDGIMGPRTVDALRDFQSRQNLNPSGEADADTCALLRTSHGS